MERPAGDPTDDYLTFNASRRKEYGATTFSITTHDINTLGIKGTDHYVVPSGSIMIVLSGV